MFCPGVLSRLECKSHSVQISTVPKAGGGKKRYHVYVNGKLYRGISLSWLGKHTPVLFCHCAEQVEELHRREKEKSQGDRPGVGWDGRVQVNAPGI